MRSRWMLVALAVLLLPGAHRAAIAQPPSTAPRVTAQQSAAALDTIWVGFSPASADVNKVAAGGRWDFESTLPDSSQFWTFTQGPSSNDAGLHPLPSQRPWWYLDHGNSVNGVRRSGLRKYGLVGVWHRDPLTGVSPPIAGNAAWCGLRAPGDVTVIDPVTGNPYNGDQQQGDFEGGTGVRSGWPGYADQWDQILYRDFPTTGAMIPLGFDMRLRLSLVIPSDPGGSAWFTPDPTSPANLETGMPDVFRVWVGVPYTGPTWDTDRRWLSEVLDYGQPFATQPALLYQASGINPPLAAGPAASTPVALMIPDYSAASPVVRVAFQVKTNRTTSDFRTGPGGFNSTDGAAVLDNVGVGPSMSTFEAANSIVARSQGIAPTAAWITTGKPAPAYGHSESLSGLPFTPVGPCNLTGRAMLLSNHDFGDTPEPESNNWAVSPTIALSGPRATAQGISSTLRNEISEVVIQFDVYGGPVNPADPEIFFSYGLRTRGTSHLALLQPVDPQIPAWTSFQSPPEVFTLGGDSCRFVLRGKVTGYVPWASVDSLQVALQSWVRCGPGASASCLQPYGGYIDNIRVGFVRGVPAPGYGIEGEFPVTFSVNGPVDPNTEGLRDARGAPATPQVPLQAGNGTGFGIRSGPVPRATGLIGLPPGDVADYKSLAVPSEAVVFQSGPPTPGSPQGSGPNGTNSQIIEPEAAGLVAGPGISPAKWTSLPPDTVARDNIDAISFGSDYFPPAISLGPDPTSPFPPAGLPALIPWDGRDPVGVPTYAEPVVLDDAPGIVFDFSVDPWAIGVAGTDLRIESGGSDVGAGLGPWTSPGRAAGDVFESNHLLRAGGVTLGGGLNRRFVRSPALGLAPVPLVTLSPMEDDLDALEMVGDNGDWETGLRYWPGNVHGRVTELGVDPPPADLSQHEPRIETPVFFSVTRNSAGAPFSAVRAQFVIDGGAAGDIFVMLKLPGDPPGIGSNLLFIDQAEIGLYALDGSPGAVGPADYTDDLDALILKVCPEFRPQLVDAIKYILAGGYGGWGTYGFGDARTGPGMTTSITSLLAGSIPPDCIQVGFSVTTDAIGLTQTAVDWEAGPVAPPGGTSTAAGDIFYAPVSGAPIGTNYLWYEEAALGLDPGAWVNGASTSLGALSDNLDALDSDSLFVQVLGVGGAPEEVETAPLRLIGAPNPSFGPVHLGFTASRPGLVRVRVLDVAGRVVAKLADGWRPAGRQRLTWDGTGGHGEPVAAGIYFVLVEADGRREIGKIVRLR